MCDLVKLSYHSSKCKIHLLTFILIITTNSNTHPVREKKKKKRKNPMDIQPSVLLVI